MASKPINNTDRIPSVQIASVIDQLVQNESRKRQSFERRWYDNNFFDDGFHFRYVSRDTGKIVDLNNRRKGGEPLRAIPKASRQIRGVANLLAGPRYVPVVYPEKITIRNYPRQVIDPQTGQVRYPDYEQAREIAKKHAQKVGNWIEKEFDNQDIEEKLILMMILAAKHGVSYLKIYPDPIEEKLCSWVCDAFDVYLQGDAQNESDSPFITFTKQELISRIKANENFDKEQVELISPDNKYATSEIKEAYMQTRFGTKFASDQTATLIQKETYLKEYVSEFNMKQIVRDLGEAAKQLKVGDQVIRQVFSAGGITLYDKYTNLSEYPIVSFRYEPGPMYQVPFIERFIPANKTLDSIVSRVEAYANTMGVVIYQKRKGENYQISNIPGGQMIEYSASPLQQMNIAPLPNFMFNLIQLLEKFIEEQGAATASLGQLPEGVRSGVAIESLKATEYANLQIATNQVKKTVKEIAMRMIDQASDTFIDPQTVMMLNKGEPDYFEIIGEKGQKAYNKLGISDDIRDAVVIRQNQHLDIEVESGLGFTQDGKKQTMQQLTQFFLQLAEIGYIKPEALKVIVEKLLEVYQFGSTQEFLDVLDSTMKDTGTSEEDLLKMKVALAETLQETGVAGKDQQDQQVDSTKVGVVEALKDLAGNQQPI
jgi:hypothetical protein